MLRSGSDVDLDAELKDGAAGDIELRSRNAIPLRGEDESSVLTPPASASTSLPAAAQKPDRLSETAAAGGSSVALLSSGGLMGKERAAGALWHLSVDSGNRMSIAKAGGIPPLVQPCRWYAASAYLCRGGARTTS